MSRADYRLWKLLSARRRLFLLAGPCVIENEALCLKIAESVRRTCERLGLPFVFKASFDKANRSSAKSFRGPGLVEGLRVLEKVQSRIGVPILTDVHTEAQAVAAADLVDILQIPAFLCRQTDLVVAAARTGRIVNLKKGQFLAPEDMANVVAKAVEAGNPQLILTERGTTFGYHNLVADMRAIPTLQSQGFPVVFDATHSVQLPGAGGYKSGGQRRFAPLLARCAVAAGVDGIFCETHPDPDHALSDGPNMIPLRQLPQVLETLVRIREALS